MSRFKIGISLLHNLILFAHFGTYKMPKTKNDKKTKLNKTLEQIIERTQSQNRFLKNLLLEVGEDKHDSEKFKEKDTTEKIEN